MSSGLSVASRGGRHAAPDPGGFNPSGLKLMTGEEPGGQEPLSASPRLPDRQSLSQPPTPANRGGEGGGGATRNHHQHHHHLDGTNSAPVMALLMQSPPPPPPSSPPRRSASRSRKSGAEFPKISPISTARTESTNESADPSPGGHYRQQQLQNSNNNNNNSNGASLVEQRLRAARAIYESDTLMLPPEEPSGQEAHAQQRSLLATTPPVKSTTTIMEPSPTSSLATQPHRNTHESSSIGLQQQLSGSSTTTTRSNSKSSGDRRRHTKSEPRKRQEQVSKSVSSGATTTPGGKNRRPSTGQAPRRRSKTPEKRSRAKTPEKRSRAKTPERQQRKTPERRRRKTPERRRGAAAAAAASLDHEEEQQQANGKGFFRRMFRRNNSNSKNKDAKTVDGSEMEETKTSQSTRTESTVGPPLRLAASAPVKTSSAVAAAPKAKPMQPPAAKDDDNEVLWPSQQKPSASKSRRSLTQNPTTSMDESFDERPEVFFAQDDVSTLTGPTVHEDYGGSSSLSSRHHNHSSTYNASRYSRDPMEAPLAQSNSTLSADPMGFYYQETQSNNDPQESYDEASHYPSIRGSSSGATGSIDPFTEPFFHHHSNSKGRESGGRKSNSKLHVITEPVLEESSGSPKEHHDDPVGESPLSSRHRRERQSTEGANNRERRHVVQDPSPHGYTATEPLDHQDPFGASPVHRHDRGPAELVDGHLFAPDPPLYRGDQENSSVELASVRQEDVPSTMLDSVMGECGGDDQSRLSLQQSDDEEKKDDDSSIPPPPPPPPEGSPTRMTVEEQLKSMPPPPPPPPPPPGSKKKKSKAKKGPGIPISPRKTENNQSNTFGNASLLERTDAENVRDSTNSGRPHGTEEEDVPTLSPPASPRRVAPPLVEKDEEHDVIAVPREPSVKRTSQDIRQVRNARRKESRGSGRSVSSIDSNEESSKEPSVIQVEEHAPMVIESRRRSVGSNIEKKENQSSTKGSRRRSTGTILEPSKEDPKIVQARIAKEKAMEIERAMKAKKEFEEQELARKTNEALQAKKQVEEFEQMRKLKESKRKEGKPVVFDSDTGEPVPDTPTDESGSKGRKSFISSLARMNAKAVAYLHTLNGEPSPRHQWHAPTEEEEEGPEQESEEGGRKFKAYSSKFKGRKLTTRQTVSPRSNGPIIETPRSANKEPSSQNWKNLSVCRDVSVHEGSVSRGIAIRRAEREALINSGKAQRVVPEVPKRKEEQQYQTMPEPKDPIQRAGRRLLSRAAVPIQSEIRRFLAQREAVDRMWALIEIQSYMRRWRAEAHMIACVQAVLVVQSIFRGRTTRVRLEQEQAAAVQVQRVVRGYLASVWAYDTVYSVILIQARVRRFVVRHRLWLHSVAATEIQKTFRGHMMRMTFTRHIAAMEIQRVYRGHAVYSATMLRKKAAVRMQSAWRTFSAHQAFQFVIVDIIIAQSVVRAHMARKEVLSRKSLLLNDAARKIQKSWRSFRAYTDYILTVVDIVLVQRACRCWLAKRRVQTMRDERAGYLQKMRDENAATKVQTQWRCYKAQMILLYDLVHIIMVQSVVRRQMAKKEVWKLRIDYEDKSASALRIQSAWRGFWQFSHYVIMQYEICRIQAAGRGMMARKAYRLKLGSSIMIQSIGRKYLARHTIANRRRTKLLIHSRAIRMCERLACEKIQFWWSVVAECRREKKAALTIEKFFIMVKKEVEREVRKFQKKQAKHVKREKKRCKQRESDEEMLERVWLSTVDENHVDVFAVPSSARSNASRATQSPSVSSVASPAPKGSPSRYGRISRHQASSPSMNLVMRHEHEETTPGAEMRPSFSFSSSHLSTRVNELKEKVSKSDLDRHLILDGAIIDAEEEQEKKKRAADKYLKMYGVNTAPNRYSREFFGDDITSPVARPLDAALTKSLGSSESADWRSPNNRSPSKAKLMAQKYLQQRKEERDQKDNSRSLNLRVEAILGDDIGMI